MCASVPSRRLTRVCVSPYAPRDLARADGFVGTNHALQALDAIDQAVVGLRGRLRFRHRGCT